MAISLPGFTYSHCHFLSFLRQHAISQSNLTWQHCWKFCCRILESQKQNLFRLCAQSPAFSPIGGCKSCFHSWVRSSRKPWVGFTCLSLSKHHEQSIGRQCTMWHGQNKEEKRRARIFTPTAHCLFVAITFCALIFHPIYTIAAVSIGFSLCFLVFWSHPMASKKGMFPLSCCSYRIIKDHPDPIHVWAPQRAKICHSWRFSERWSQPRSLLRELSLDPHSIRMPQNAHHLAEQIQKTGVWCPIG